MESGASVNVPFFSSFSISDSMRTGYEVLYHKFIINLTLFSINDYGEETDWRKNLEDG